MSEQREVGRFTATKGTYAGISWMWELRDEWGQKWVALHTDDEGKYYAAFDGYYPEPVGAKDLSAIATFLNELNDKEG
jgi:hypothetical protein